MLPELHYHCITSFVTSGNDGVKSKGGDQLMPAPPSANGGS